MQTNSLVAVVDDESAICRALARLLRSAGFDVVTFESGTSFLAAVDALRPGCLILDVNMPSMSGFDLQLRLARGKTHVPVVIITGLDSPEAHDRAMANGAFAYIPKPVDDQLLIRTVRDAIAGSGPRP